MNYCRISSSLGVDVIPRPYLIGGEISNSQVVLISRNSILLVTALNSYRGVCHGNLIIGILITIENLPSTNYC